MQYNPLIFLENVIFLAGLIVIFFSGNEIGAIIFILK